MNILSVYVLLGHRFLPETQLLLCISPFLSNPRAAIAFIHRLAFLFLISSSFLAHGDFLSGQLSYAFKIISVVFHQVLNREGVQTIL